MGLSARERLREKYTLQKHMETLTALYKEIFVVLICQKQSRGPGTRGIPYVRGCGNTLPESLPGYKKAV